MKHVYFDQSLLYGLHGFTVFIFIVYAVFVFKTYKLS